MRRRSRLINRLLSKLVSADEVQGAYGAQYQWPGGRGIDYPKDNPERASSWAAVSQKSEHIDICDASSTGATQQFAAEVEFRKKSIKIFLPVASSLWPEAFFKCP